MSDVLPEFTPAAESMPADWLEAPPQPYTYRVDSLVPAGFPAFARVFHRPRLAGEEVRWRAVAEANDRIFHPAVEWGSLVGAWSVDAQAGLWDEAPAVGALSPRIARDLAAVLGAHTDVAETCWFAAWTGWGCRPAWHGVAAQMSWARRTMALLSGPLSAAAQSVCAGPGHQSASLWWPDDRRWCVVTDIDLMTTYVGGTRECVTQIIATPSLEAEPVPSTQGITWETDEVNPRPIQPGSR